MIQSSFRDESNLLLNRAIDMACHLIKKHGNCIPFCIAVTTNGELNNITADDSVTQDREVLVESLRSHIKTECFKNALRSVAFVKNVVDSTDLSKTAIEISIHQKNGDHVTCYLPYTLCEDKVDLGDLYATDPSESFFSKSIRPS